MFVLLTLTIPRSFYFSEYELLTAVTKGNQTTGNYPFGSVTLYVKCHWKEAPGNNRCHRTMGSQTIEVTDLPKEENNRDIQNKGTIGFLTRRLGHVTL